MKEFFDYIFHHPERLSWIITTILITAAITSIVIVVMAGVCAYIFERTCDLLDDIPRGFWRWLFRRIFHKLKFFIFKIHIVFKRFIDKNRK